MRRLLIFFFTILITGKIISIPICLNESYISENCISSIFEERNYELFLRYVDIAKFVNTDKKNVMKIIASYNRGLYKTSLAHIKKLSKEKQESLFILNLKLKLLNALKKYKQSLNLLEEIKTDYPAFYENKALICTEADIYHSWYQYDEAVPIYDECLKKNKNEVAAYKRLQALEKGNNAKEELVEEYIDFIEQYRFSFLKQKVLNRLIRLKKYQRIPDDKSPWFSRWLHIMRKNDALDQFYTKEYKKLKHPARLQIVYYLKNKKRYREALELIDQTLVEVKRERLIYLYGWQKYRVLYYMGNLEKTAEYLIDLSQNLTKRHQDRAFFFAGIMYFENNQLRKAIDIFEEIIYQDKESKYFLLALYKTGLIYLFQGNDYYTYTLWANFLYTTRINGRKYYYGYNLLSTMRQLTVILDQINNSFLFSYQEDCRLEEDGICHTGEFISYYDFIYYHILSRNELHDGQKIGVTEQELNLWKKNSSIDRATVRKEILYLLGKQPAVLKKSEELSMLQFFTEQKIDQGILFYTQYIEMFGSHINKRRIKIDENTEALWRKLYKSFADDKIFAELYYYTHQYTKTIDFKFEDVKDSLKFSPFYGDKESWKILYPTPYIDEVLRLSSEFNISPALLYSIMRAETFYRDYLTSPVGAVGLMQVMPNTFAKISAYGGIRIKDPFDPYESMKAAAWYLAKLLRRFDNNIVLATAAYNAGPHKVSPWLKRFDGVSSMIFIELIPYLETRNYVKKVLRYFQIYSYLYEENFYNLRLGETLEIDEKPTVIDF